MTIFLGIFISATAYDLTPGLSFIPTLNCQNVTDSKWFIMNKMTFKWLVCLLWVSISAKQAQAQGFKRICVMGSSTSFGYFGNPAIHPRDSAWAFKLKKFYKDAGIIDTLFNIAANGTNCYTGMPTSYTPPPGRSAPNPSFNITRAVNLIPKPDVIIVNYPTNQYDFLSNTEIISCLQTIKDSANAKNIRCYITTTQPRDNFNAAERQKLKDLKALIENTFGVWSIDFWTDIVQDPPIVIRPVYAFGDQVHINPAGHTVLKDKVIEKNIFFGGVLATRFAHFRLSAIQNAVELYWETLSEDPGSRFRIEKSTDGNRFQTIATVNGQQSAATTRRYQYTDLSPAPGINYYRIAALSQTGTEEFSTIARINFSPQPRLIGLLYPTAGGRAISFSLQTGDPAFVTLRLTDLQGRQYLTQRVWVPRQLIHTVNLPGFAAGTYLLQVQSGAAQESRIFIPR
jgi:hypothetical protein